MNMSVNKVVMNTPDGENVLIDLTADTVTPDSMDEGVIAHNAAGAKIVGTRSQHYTVTTTGTGDSYIAEVKGVTELKAGIRFVMIPHVDSTSSSPGLNVNGLGSKMIRRRISSNTATTTTGSTNDWLSANKPIEVVYDGMFWIADLPRPNAADIMGVVPVSNGGVPAPTDGDNGKVLSVVGKVPTWVTSSGQAGSRAKVTTIKLPVDRWVEKESNALYTMDVEIPSVTVNSQIDLRPTATQMLDLIMNETSLMAVNDSGNVTISAIGIKPWEDYDMQIAITEVDVV